MAPLSGSAWGPGLFSVVPTAVVFGCVGAGPALCTRVLSAHGLDHLPRAAPTGFSGRTGLTEGTAQLPPRASASLFDHLCRFLHPSWTIHILKKPPHRPVGTVPTPSGLLSPSVLVTGSDGAARPTEPGGPRTLRPPAPPRRGSFLPFSGCICRVVEKNRV